MNCSGQARLRRLETLSRYVRKLRLPGGAPPMLLSIAPGPGMLVAHSWADLGLHVFNVNARHLVSAEGNERLNALAVTPDGRFLLTGGQRGVVSLHWLHSLEVILNTSLCHEGRVQACKISISLSPEGQP